MGHLGGGLGDWGGGRRDVSVGGRGWVDGHEA